MKTLVTVFAAVLMGTTMYAGGEPKKTEVTLKNDRTEVEITKKVNTNKLEKAKAKINEGAVTAKAGRYTVVKYHDGYAIVKNNHLIVKGYTTTDHGAGYDVTTHQYTAVIK